MRQALALLATALLVVACPTQSEHENDAFEVAEVQKDVLADTGQDVEVGKEVLDSGSTEVEDEVDIGMTKRSKPLMLAFYYAWYGTPEVSGSWFHWNSDGHNPEDVDEQGLQDLAAAHHPVQGAYDSNDANVLDKQIELAEYAGLDGFIVSWWGIDTFEDKAGLKLLHRLEERDSSLKACIYYEVVPQQDEDAAIADLEYILQNWAESDKYLRIDGKVAIFVYYRAIYRDGKCGVTIGDMVPDLYDWNYIRSSLSEEIFLVGDLCSPLYGHRGKIAQTMGFDGWHFYNLAFDLWIGTPIDKYMKKVSDVKQSINSWSAVTIIPGYDDTKLNRPFTFKVDREEGQLFVKLWNAAVELETDAILITSFNEWHEGTEIEPSVEFGDSYIELLHDLVSQTFGAR